MKTINEALIYAVRHLGDDRDEGYCLRFVAACYGVGVTGLGSALELSRRLRRDGLLYVSSTSPAPPGALVFYDPPGCRTHHIPGEFRGMGHVTLSLGSGWEIGTSYPRYPGAVGITRRGHYGGYLGWTAARWLVDLAGRPA